MTSRERVINALKRKGKVDKTPFEISWGTFTPRLMKTYREKTGSELPPEDYFDFDTRFVLPGPSIRNTDFRRYFKHTTIDKNAVFDEWGVGSVPTAYEIPDYKYHPLEHLSSAREIDRYPWPDLDAGYRYNHVQEQTAKYHERGYAVCGEMYQTIFETAWLMRGMENFMLDLLLNEDIAHSICENLTRIRIRQAVHFAEAGVDILRLGDDVVSQQGLMMSRDIYNVYFKPRVRRIIQAAKTVNPDIIIFMHSCGKVEEMIDDFIEAGVEVLNPLQPECNDLRAIHEKYRDKLAFWGGIGVQSVMPHGSPDEVAFKVREVNDLFGRDNGFLIAPAHILDPAIPWENVVAYIDAARNLKNDPDAIYERYP
jgi:uroporphyrinogen decarboxylase